MSSITDPSHLNGTTNGKANGHEVMNAWQQPGPAAFDFRSDVLTTPTHSMLKAISNTTLLDDVYAEDPTTNSLQTFIAELTSHEDSLLVMSGTMGNQVAIRAHLQAPPHSVVCDVRSHINNYEAGGISTLSGAMLIPVRPSNNHYLTLEDIKTHAILSDDIHACPTRLISLENTLNGMIMPLSELQKISTFAKQHDMILHMDGARLWEAVASGAGSLPAYTSLVDSASLCFSKGLGAPLGSIIIGNKKFITQARRIRKMFGGGTRQAGVISAPARVAIEETFGRGPNGEGGKLRESHKRATRIAEMWTSRGGELVHPTETNMVWLDLKKAGLEASEFAEIVSKEGIKANGGRLVVHYQITDEAENGIERAIEKIMSKKTTDGV